MSVVITILENGPAIIHSDSPIVIENHKYVGTKVALCRCQKSLNLPFCDGNHAKKEAKVVNFKTTYNEIEEDDGA